MAGTITDAELPFTMDLDYVRVYKNSYLTDGDFEGEKLTGWTSTGTDATRTTANAQTGTKTILIRGERRYEEFEIDIYRLYNAHHRLPGSRI